MNKIRKFLAWTFAVLLIFIGVSIFLNIRSSMVFLSKETMILPKIEYSDTDLDSMNNIFEVLKHPQDHHGEKVMLRDTQINLMFKDKLDLENRFYIHFEENKANVRFSLPVPFVRRFANGSCSAEISYSDTDFHITISNLTINDILMSDAEINSLESVLINYLDRDKRVKEYVKFISEAFIQDNILHIEFIADNDL